MEKLGEKHVKEVNVPENVAIVTILKAFLNIFMIIHKKLHIHTPFNKHTPFFHT